MVENFIKVAIESIEHFHCCCPCVQVSDCLCCQPGACCFFWEYYRVKTPEE